jgi:hypothetical protein
VNAPLTPKQRALARHALGFDGRHKESYRNHFVTGPGSSDYDEWMDMVQKGFAIRREGTPLSGGDDVFWCTRETALFVREKDEHLSREFRP